MNRKAFSVVEVTIALVVLTAAAVAVGRFTVEVHRGLDARDLSRRLGWEIENVRERILSWNPAEVSVDRIESIPVSEQLMNRLSDARWSAEVEEITTPIKATQITLRLQCTLYSQRSEPETLTFWIEAQEMENRDSENREMENRDAP